MFVIVTHCAFFSPLSPPSISVLTLLMLHNEIHPSQLGGVAVCCGVVGIRDWGCVCMYPCICICMRGRCLSLKQGALHVTTVLKCVENWFQSGQKPHAARSLSTRVSIYTHTQINPPHTCCRRVFLFWEEEGLMTYILQSETSFQPPPQLLSSFLVLHSNNEESIGFYT